MAIETLISTVYNDALAAGIVVKIAHFVPFSLKFGFTTIAERCNFGTCNAHTRSQKGTKRAIATDSPATQKTAFTR